jgi:hypothetical protein
MAAKAKSAPAPAPVALESDPATLVNPAPASVAPETAAAVIEPARSAVEVVEDLTAKTESPVAKPSLFVWNGFQYGCQIRDKMVALDLPALANGLPQVGDACSLNPGDGYFQPKKIKHAEKDEAFFVLVLADV